jgi:hypothetical protein
MLHLYTTRRFQEFWSFVDGFGGAPATGTPADDASAHEVTVYLSGISDLAGNRCAGQEASHKSFP